MAVYQYQVTSLILMMVITSCTLAQTPPAESCNCHCNPGSPMGPPGLPGVQGPQGITGPAGDPGSNGIPGTPGLSGQFGSPGLKGEKGDLGQGSKGQPGEAGIQGSKGEQGLNGLSLPGPRGHPGKVGPQGIMGLPSEKGDKGHSGVKGDKGQGGQSGVVGPKGIKGGTGRKGNVGHQGFKGESGISYTAPPMSAFSVRKTTNQHVSSGTQVITFGAEDLDVGNDFNPSTGVFTCRIQGLYYFSFSFLPDDDHSCNIYLELNGVQKAKIWRFPLTDNDVMQSQSIILSLQVGSEVKLTAVAPTYINTQYGDGTNIFNGYLINAT